MLGLHQLYVLTSLSTTQTRALAASSLMLRRVRLDSRLVHRVRAITKSRPRMAPLACAVEVTDVGADICIQTESLARSYERTAAAFTGSRDLSSARADAWIFSAFPTSWRSD